MIDSIKFQKIYDTIIAPCAIKVSALKLCAVFWKKNTIDLIKGQLNKKTFNSRGMY
jgi:hypothetical protein